MCLKHCISSQNPAASSNRAHRPDSKEAHLALASLQSYRSEGKSEADSGDTFGLHDVSIPVQVNSAPQHDYETETQEQLRAASGSIADPEAAAAGPGATRKPSHSHLSTDEKADIRYSLGPHSRLQPSQDVRQQRAEQLICLLAPCLRLLQS